MNLEEKFYIIGVDGGASKTRGVLFTPEGDTIASIIDKGSNITLNAEAAANRLGALIRSLCRKAEIPTEYIDAVGLGLAGASNKDGRDLVFRQLDEFNLSKRAIIANDAEAAYEINCPEGFGVLVTAGTGVICIARDQEGKTLRTAGKGHDKGDKGSGFWIGYQAILNLSVNESSVIGDEDLEEILAAFLSHLQEEDFNTAVENLKESEDMVPDVAGFAETVISLAEKGNEVAVNIIQEATHALSEYIITLTDELDYHENQIILTGNGSIIRNDYFRYSLNDELRFDFPEIKWVFSSISPAYGAGILAARMQDVEVKISDIIKGNALAA